MTQRFSHSSMVFLRNQTGEQVDELGDGGLGEDARRGVGFGGWRSLVGWYTHWYCLQVKSRPDR